MSKKNQWYVICYDISDAKRLLRVHKIVKNRGVALQKSVFLLHVRETEAKNILNKIAEMINPKYDDIRLYPVISPDRIWASGGIIKNFPLF